MNNYIRAAIYGMLGHLIKNTEHQIKMTTVSEVEASLRRQVLAMYATQALYVESLPTPDDGPE